MDNLKDEIKKRVDIVEYIGSYVNLKKTGRNFKGNCPFHKEKTPSFIVSPERQIWHCFGSCGDGGDVISFMMKWENITYVEALKEFASTLHLPFNEQPGDDTASKQRIRLFAANKLAAQFYHFVLSQSSVGSKAQEYLEERKIRKEIIKTFEIGYAPSSWDSLTRFLTAKKFSQKELLDAGLVIKSEKGSVYDRFRGRLVFPIRDPKANIIGFSGRILDKNEKAAKYVNTPETVIYRKRESLFGIHLAKEAIKDKRAAILVEGEFDMITPYQEGISNVVAIKGSAVTKEQLLLLKRYTNRVYLALDADAAGAEAIKRGIEEAESLEFELGVIVFGSGKDPDEAVRTDPIAFKKTLEKPVPVYDYIIDFYQKKYPGDDAFSKKNLGEAVGPFLSFIKNPIVESYYVKKLAALLGVDEISVKTLMHRQKMKKAGSAKQFAQPSSSRQQRNEQMQKYLLSLLLQSEKKTDILEKLSSIISVDHFSFPAFRQIYDFLIQNKRMFKSGDTNINTIIDMIEQPLKALVDELYMFASSGIDLEDTSVEKIAYDIKEYALKQNLKELLSLPSSEENEAKLTKINAELKELEKKLGKIYNT